MSRRNKIEASVIPCDDAVERYQDFFNVSPDTPDPGQQRMFEKLRVLDRGKHTKFVMVCGSGLDKDHTLRLDGLFDISKRVQQDCVAKDVSEKSVFYLFLPSRELFYTLRNSGLISPPELAGLEADIKASIPIHIS